MTRLVKKAAAAKNIPLLALALFAAVFFGSEALASFKVQADEHWVYDADNCTDPLNPDCYSFYNGELDGLCENESEICGIVAPEAAKQNPNDPQRPEITDTQLIDDIQNQETGNGLVFLLPEKPM